MNWNVVLPIPFCFFNILQYGIDGIGKSRQLGKS